MTIEQLKQSIAELDNNIEQGQQFEQQGYDCDMMLSINYVLRDKLVKELNLRNELAKVESDLQYLSKLKEQGHDCGFYVELLYEYRNRLMERLKEDNEMNNGAIAKIKNLATLMANLEKLPCEPDDGLVSRMRLLAKEIELTAKRVLENGDPKED